MHKMGLPMRLRCYDHGFHVISDDREHIKLWMRVEAGSYKAWHVWDANA